MKIFHEKVLENGPAGKQTKKGYRTRQKKKKERGDSKVKSNDSSEIPDIRHTRHPFKGRWEDNIREWTGLEFAKSQRAVKKTEKLRKLVVK